MGSGPPLLFALTLAAVSTRRYRSGKQSYVDESLFGGSKRTGAAQVSWELAAGSRFPVDTNPTLCCQGARGCTGAPCPRALSSRRTRVPNPRPYRH